MMRLISPLSVFVTGAPVLFFGLVFILQCGAQAMEILPDSETVSSADPSVRAVLFEPVPDGAVIEVFRPDATDMSETVAQRVEDMLAERGYIISEDGDFGLRFVFGGFPEGPDRRKNVGVSAFGQGGSESETEVGVSVRVTGSGQPQKSTSRPVTLRMSLARRGRPPIWAGRATVALTPGDRDGTALSLTDSLLAQFGKNFESTPNEN